MKIKALKVGTAKVPCKVGKKKLACKVTVKAKNKEQIPQPTSQATILPTLVPMSTPSQTTEPTGLPIRTHAPTEDRLMVEPAQFTFIPTSDDNGLPIDCVGGPNSSYLLCEVGGVSGLEHLYTSEVTNMSYMFYQYREELKKWIIAPENNCAISETWVLVVEDNGVLEN